MHVTYVHILTLKCPQIQSQSIHFSKFSWGGMPPDPPSISMLCTMEHYSCLPPSSSYALLSGIQYNIAPPSNTLHLISTPLDQNPERNPDQGFTAYASAPIPTPYIPECPCVAFKADRFGAAPSQINRLVCNP